MGKRGSVLFLANFDEILEQLKAGAGKLGETVGNAAKAAVSKVESKTAEAKIRYSISRAEERLKLNYQAIGEAVYKAYKSNTEPEDFSVYFERIKSVEEEIKELKKQLCEECEVTVCPGCKEIIKSTDAYCPVCGVRIKDE